MERATRSAMLSTERALAAADLILTRAEVFEAMGDGSEHEEGDPLSVEVDELCAEALTLVAPRYAWHEVSGTLSMVDASLQMSEGEVTFQLGRIIAVQLMKAESFLLFTATLGHEYDEWMVQLKQSGDMLKIYIADAIGSILVEKVADIMEVDLQQFLDEDGRHHTARFSPGYCGWHLSEQPRLFSLFPMEHPCDIRLTDSCLMLPIKSVSGIVGLGPNVTKIDYACRLCDYAMCFRRKQRKS